jgi:aspartate/methionine/tyrosine aminotransferase
MLTNPHNPSGSLTDDATLLAIGRLASQVRAYVLVDEVYLDTVVPPRESAALLSMGFVATSSLTKSFGLSGLRCGWIVASPEMAERCWRLNELFGVAQAHPAERLSCIALEWLDEIAAEIPAHLAANRALANEFFAGRSDLEVAPMVHGLSAFPRLPGGDPDALEARLRDHYDTAIVPGRFFGLADHFRIGVGGPSEMVAEGLKRLGKALDELK